MAVFNDLGITGLISSYFVGDFLVSSFADCGTSVLLFFCPMSPGALLFSVVLIEPHVSDSLSF